MTPAVYREQHLSKLIILVSNCLQVSAMVNEW